MEPEKYTSSQRLYCYTNKEIVKYLKRIGYTNIAEAVGSYISYSKNSDGSAIRFYDWLHRKGLMIECDGSVKEFNIPGDKAWFNDESEAVAWLRDRKVYFKNGLIEEPPFRTKGIDPSGSYFLKGEDPVQLFSIKKPDKKLAEIDLLGTGAISLFVKNNELYVFDSGKKNRKIEGYVFFIKDHEKEMRLGRKISIPYPTVTSYSPYVVDFCPWDDVVLICDPFDWPYRSIFYEFRLSTKEVKKVGRATFIGLYLQCDILKDS